MYLKLKHWIDLLYSRWWWGQCPVIDMWYTKLYHSIHLHRTYASSWSNYMYISSTNNKPHTVIYLQYVITANLYESCFVILNNTNKMHRNRPLYKNIKLIVISLKFPLIISHNNNHSFTKHLLLLCMHVVSLFVESGVLFLFNISYHPTTDKGKKKHQKWGYW